MQFAAWIAATVLLVEPPDPVVEEIRRRFAETNAKQAQLTRTVKSVISCSLEGGKLEIFKDNGRVQKAVMLELGESYRITTEYYFLDSGEPDFGFRKFERYDMPTVGKVFSTDEDRMYFSGGKVHAWTAGKRAKPLPKAKLPALQKGVLKEFARVLSAARSPGDEVECQDHHLPD